MLSRRHNWQKDVINAITFFARRKLARTMPGEMGALAANRYGWLIG